MPDYQKQLMTCFEISKAVASTLNMKEILSIVLRRLSELILAQNWTLYLLDEEKKELSFEVVVGLEMNSVSDVRIRLGEGIAGTVALSGEPILVARDVHKDPRFSKKVDDMTGFVTRSLICLPLKIEGQVLGVIEVINPEDPALFDERFLPVLWILADFVAIAIANARNHRKIETLTVMDDVTGFFNTRFLHEYLDELLAAGETVSLVFLDLDHFKRVVDTHGHLLGSRMLKEVAETAAACLAPRDRLVRYGGDEFIIILPGQDKQQAKETVLRLREALIRAEFLVSEGLRVKIRGSFGIANYPRDASDKARLLQLADEAMYQSKKLGKDRTTLA
jgi:diguanylate cyclase (GGDEF)-like protein